MAASSWFHVQDGLHFRRTEDGGVEVGTGPDFNSVDPITVLPAESWASVVAFVSERGEMSTTYAEALAFHTAVL